MACVTNKCLALLEQGGYAPRYWNIQDWARAEEEADEEWRRFQWKTLRFIFFACCFAVGAGAAHCS